MPGKRRFVPSLRQTFFFSSGKFPLFLASQQSQVLSPDYVANITVTNKLVAHGASMPSQWVHARSQAHWVWRGGLGSLSLVLLCLVSLAVCPVPVRFTCFYQKCSLHYQRNQPCRFSAANSSLHPPLCSLSQVLEQETLNEIDLKSKISLSASLI